MNRFYRGSLNGILHDLFPRQWDEPPGDNGPALRTPKLFAPAGMNRHTRKTEKMRLLFPAPAG